MIKHKVTLFVSLLLTLLSLQAWGQAQWLKGTAWEYQSCDSKNIMCSVKDFTFHPSGKFNLDAYPPLRHEGQYKIVQTSPDGNELKLDLSQQKGDLGSWKNQMTIKRNKDGAIMIDGEGPYQKLKYITKPDHYEPGEK